MDITTFPVPDRVRALAARRHVPQSVLIEGPDAQTRDNAALFLAAAVVCTGDKRPCGVCRDCRKTFSSLHPDVVTVEPEEKRKFITVDQIRALRTQAYIRPNEAENRVFLIRDAERMNEEAQNALLKLLEEPPDTVCLILTASSAARLLSTVRSRLTRVPVGAGGKRDDPLQDDATRALFTAIRDRSAYDILKTLHAVVDDRVGAAAVFDGVRAALTQVIACKKGVDVGVPDEITSAAAALTAEQLVRLTAWCERAVTRMNQNANRVLSAVSLSADVNQILGI